MICFFLFEMANKLASLKGDFGNGLISKADYIAQSYQCIHSFLHELAGELPNTDIATIEVTDDMVCVVSRRDGIRLLVDKYDQRSVPLEILNFNTYEPELSSIVRSLAPFMNTMLDIGANIGWYSLLVSKVNPGAAIHAFEPIPVTFQRLADNIELNRSANVCLHNYGLSSRSGTFPFFFYPEGSGNASLRNLTSRPDAQVFECTLNTLSEIESKLAVSESIDFIKCDVEGNELFVVEGGLSVIEKHKPILLLELLRKWSAPFGYHPNDVISLLGRYGYAAYASTAAERLEPIQRVTEATVETNFFFVHPHSRLRDKLPIG